MDGTDEINRYRSAPKNADHTIDQDWGSVTDAEHDRWNRLAARMADVLAPRACREFLAARDRLDLAGGGVPDMAKLSEALMPLTGWQVVPVADLVPDAVFFDHLANRRFPAGAFIRPESQFDYLEEPDIFHDVYGHVPLLADPVYADFMQAYGEGGARALERGQLRNLARLYWYTVEFGLVRQDGGLKLFGAGIMSSPGEALFALEAADPHRIAFDLERVMCTDYIIDDYQKTYFVIDSFDALRAACAPDFGPLYDRLAGAPAIAPHDVSPSDTVVTEGTLARWA